MTAHAMKGDRDCCLEAGMDDYVTKPIDPARLLEVLEKWLSPEPAVELSIAPAPAAPAEKPAPAQVPGASPDPPVFVRERLMDMVAGDRDLGGSGARMVLDQYLENAPEQISPNCGLPGPRGTPPQAGRRRPPQAQGGLGQCVAPKALAERRRARPGERRAANADNLDAPLAPPAPPPPSSEFCASERAFEGGTSAMRVLVAER
jgi:hypothetical protein